MEKNKHHGGSGFFWGLIIGAVLATLLTNKKGRKLLREVLDLGLELLEEFIEDKSQQAAPTTVIQEVPVVTQDETEEIKEDLGSQVAAVDDSLSQTTEVYEETEPEIQVEVETTSVVPDIEESKANGNGHPKKRLFRGIRRSK